MLVLVNDFSDYERLHILNMLVPLICNLNYTLKTSTPIDIPF